MELRYSPLGLDNQDGNSVQGIAISYGTNSKPLNFSKSNNTFIEVISPGAARDVIRGDTVALYEHDVKAPLGRNGQNLTLNETAAGVSYSIKLPDTQLGRDIRELVKGGILRGASFYIDVEKGGDKWMKLPDGQLYRYVNKLRSLPEISLVISPAYPDTSAALRSYQEYEAELAHIEEAGVLETLNKQRLLIIQRLND